MIVSPVFFTAFYILFHFLVFVLCCCMIPKLTNITTGQKIWRKAASPVVPLLFGSKTGFGNNVERNFVLSRKSKQIEHVQFFRLYCSRQKRQQYRSNIRNCRKNRSTCSIRQRCFDIVAGVDWALSPLHTRSKVPATLSNATSWTMFNLFRLCRKDEILQ